MIGEYDFSYVFALCLLNVFTTLFKKMIFSKLTAKIFYLLLFHVFIAIESYGQNWGLCANPSCSVPISEGKTLVPYTRRDGSNLVFEAGETVLIYVKDYGPRKDLGIQYKKIRDFIGKILVQETRVHYHGSLTPASFDFRILPHPTSHSSLHIPSSVQNLEGTLNQPKPSVLNNKHHETAYQQYQSPGFKSAETENQNVISRPSIDIGNLQGSMKSTDISLQDISNEANFLSGSLHPSPKESHTMDNIVNSQPSGSFGNEHLAHITQHSNGVETIDSSLGSSKQYAHGEKSKIYHNFVGDEAVDTDSSITRELLRERGVAYDEVMPTENSEPESSVIKQNLLPSHNKYAQMRAHNYVVPTHNNAPVLTSTLPSTLATNVLHSIDSVVKVTDGMNAVNTIENEVNEFHYDEKDDSSDDTNIESEADDFDTNSEENVSDVYTSKNFSPLESNIEITQVITKQTSRSEYDNVTPSPVHPQETSSVSTDAVDNNSKDSSIFDSQTPKMQQSEMNEDNAMNSNFKSSESAEQISVKISNKVLSTVSEENEINPTHEKVPDVIETNSNLIRSETHSSENFNLKQSETDILENNPYSKIPLSEQIEDNSNSGLPVTNSELPVTNSDTSVTGNSNPSQTENVDPFVKKTGSPTATDNYHSFATKDYSNQSMIESYNQSMSESIASSSTENYNSLVIENSDSSLIENSDSSLIDNSDSSLIENSDSSSIENSDLSSIENSVPPETVYYDSSVINNLEITNNSDALETENYDIHDNDNESSHTESFKSKEEQEHGVTSSYQTRDLKQEPASPDDSSSDFESIDQTSTYFTFENIIEALRTGTEAVMMLIPEPLYSYIMDFEKQGVPPRVIVFTGLSAVPCLILMIATFYIKEKSKEKKLSDQLLVLEKRLYSLTVEKDLLEEKLQTASLELSTTQENFEKEEELVKDLNYKLSCSKEQTQDFDSELKTSLQTIDFLQKKENEYLSTLSAVQKDKNILCEQNDNLEKRLKEEEDSVSSLATQLQEMEEEVKKLQDEKESFIQTESENEAKISQLQLNCKQLLQEAEVWNIRVSELSDQISNEKALKEEQESCVETQKTEIESLKNAIQAMEAFANSSSADENGSKSMEEKLNSLMDASTIKIQLQQEQEEKEALLEKLMFEKNKVLEFEVQLMEAKSESTKLKNSYNQALQDKTEAQTKLDVLTNYFKDKEIQLQKQLGVQEAVRQRTEDDATSAERRIRLIEDENVSYKYQVATMKQEIEETERNLKNQIAAQEKKAHENWLAARAAERKFEEVKQEAAQLQQRLTLFERESEMFANSSHEDIIRPVPKRYHVTGEKALASPDANSSTDLRFGGFNSHHLPPPPPLMLPPDRPLPPLLPPPPHPAFMPPHHLDPGMPPPPFRPWPDADFHMSPPDYVRGRESTPPRGHHQSMVHHDRDVGPHTSSPMSAADMKDSRNSTPPHSLPHFVDKPPMGFYPPPPPTMHYSRFPLPPQFRREHPRPTDTRSTDMNAPLPSQQSSSERWQHPNSQV